ncbi:hypothetical protein G7046_g4297 [Stylonectria norvegica]|nr:hypothetical protein G7046_g4297 [Stylonectria norvegica]
MGLLLFVDPAYKNHPVNKKTPSAPEANPVRGLDRHHQSVGDSSIWDNNPGLFAFDSSSATAVPLSSEQRAAHAALDESSELREVLNRMDIRAGTAALWDAEYQWLLRTIERNRST